MAIFATDSNICRGQGRGIPALYDGPVHVLSSPSRRGQQSFGPIFRARSEGEGGCLVGKMDIPGYSALFLPTLVASCPWTSATAVEELHEVIRQCPLIAPLDALPLLECADAVVRHYAVQCLESATEKAFLRYFAAACAGDEVRSKFRLDPFALHPAASGKVSNLQRCDLFWRLYSEVAHNNTLQVGFVLAVLLRVAPLAIRCCP